LPKEDLTGRAHYSVITTGTTTDKRKSPLVLWGRVVLLRAKKKGKAKKRPAYKKGRIPQPKIEKAVKAVRGPEAVNKEKLRSSRSKRKIPIPDNEKAHPTRGARC